MKRPPTSVKAFLSATLALCRRRITFLAPSTTAASIRNRCRSSSTLSSNASSRLGSYLSVSTLVCYHLRSPTSKRNHPLAMLIIGSYKALVHSRCAIILLRNAYPPTCVSFPPREKVSRYTRNEYILPRTIPPLPRNAIYHNDVLRCATQHCVSTLNTRHDGPQDTRCRSHCSENSFIIAVNVSLLSLRSPRKLCLNNDTHTI